MIEEHLQDITLIHGDCMDYMKSLPDKAFDLAIVDPPYGIGESGESNHSRDKLAKAKRYKNYAGNDLEPPSVEYFKELLRVSENQIIWGANHFISRNPIDSSCWIVWDKNNSGDFADCELAWTSFKSAVRLFKFTWNGMLQENMKDKEIRQHPNQKPVQLYKWLLKNYANPTDTILDTHGGSFSSAIAAHDGHFKFTGIELDADYYEAAKKRIIYHQRQQNLF